MKNSLILFLLSILTGFMFQSKIVNSQDTTIVVGPLTFDIFNASCSYEPQGAIDLTVDQVAFPGPYTYFWQGGYGFTYITEDLAYLYPTSYSVTVTGQGGNIASGSVNVGQPQSLQLSIDITNENCNSLGSIDLSVSGGTTPYSYYWNNGVTTQDISNLSAGQVYTVLVTDANLCNAVTSDMVSLDIIDIVISVTDVSYYGGNDGEIQLSVSGTPPFTFHWQEGNQWVSGGTTICINDTLSDRPAGFYAVQITDGNGCVADTSIEITEPPNSNIIIQGPLTFEITDAACAYEPQGAINLTVDPVAFPGPYTFSWTSSYGFIYSTEDISNIYPGSYIVTVTGQGGSTANGTVSVGEPTSLQLQLDISDENCNSTGSIDLSVSGGTSPYSYFWNTGEITQDISNLAVGQTYTVLVTDANMCNAVASGMVNLDIIDIVISVTDVSYYGGNDGEIQLSVSGTPPFTFHWQEGNQWVSGGTTICINDTLSDRPAGFYAVQITDGNGCVADTSIEITEPTNLNFPDWSSTITSTNHTILIQEATPITINGIQIESGDYIGVFYDSLGILACGGYQIWDGASTTITAWGEDIGNDGFIVGEEFKWKIWDASENVEYIANATYMPVPPMTDQGFFAVNGLSGISSLTASESQEISLPLGWSLFSTYINPFDSSIDSIFNEIVSNVEIVKNYLG